eukprot:6240892-Ditylum_brightwellii.AAC.1
MILHQENIDYKRHCQFIFGEYVLAHNEPSPSNINSPRALNCIYLHLTSSFQGGHELLRIQTNEVVLRGNYNKETNKVLFKSAAVAKVDYDTEEFNDNDYYTDEEDDGSDSNSESNSDSERLEEYDEVDKNELTEILNKSVLRNNLHHPTDQNDKKEEIDN